MKTTCPHCTQEFDVQFPQAPRKGKLAGIELTEMTDEQLRVEVVNASSVLAKAVKRGAAAEVIANAEIRVEAAKAERANRKAIKAAEKAENVEEVKELADIEVPVVEETL